MKLKRWKLLVMTLTLAVGIISSLKPMEAASKKDVTWSKVTKEIQSNDLYDVTYNKSKVYVAVGDDGQVIRSVDTKSWKNIPLKTSKNLRAIATNGSKFVAVGEDGTIIRSADGTSWSKSSFSVNYTYEQLAGKAKSYLSDEYKVSWKTKVKQSQFQFSDIIWDGKKYVAIAYCDVETGSLKLRDYYDSTQKLRLGGSFVLYSKDGVKWTVKYMDEIKFEKIVFTGKQYTVISERGVGNSKDLVSWKISKPSIRGVLTDIIYENGTYMATAWDGYYLARTGGVYTSTDGVKWKAIYNKKVIGSGVGEDDNTYGKPNGFSDLMMFSVLWDGKQYVISGYTGMILTSAKGTNWEMVNTKWDVTYKMFDYNNYSGKEANLRQSIYDGGQYISVGDNGTILVTKDLKTGVVARTRIPVDFTNIEYDGKNRYIAYGSEGTLWESSTGYNWTSVELSIKVGNPSWDSVAVHNGRAIAAYSPNWGISYGDSSYFYSDKAGEWKEMEFPDTVSNVYGVDYLNGKFRVYTNNGILVSEDGLTFSKFSSTKIPLKHAIYNNKIYIAQNGSNANGNKENVLYSSKDGKKWSKIAVKKGGKKCYLTAASVVWNGKQFVTIGGNVYEWDDQYHGENTVAFSNDGINWTLKKADDNTYIAGTYADKTYIAIDDYGKFYSSANGIDYKASARVTSHIMEDVLWDGTKFLSVGDSGVILAALRNKDEKLPSENRWIESYSTYTLRD
ncbi:hypothetical protein acsn021_10410 [Anaerocolumna cellulosilytica]|uniref:Uncharacterized protein n=1 Tax=Anaerocolumna cellulosilytica TaxID=433286 RepID=A0A6S6R1S9_9FIRM|nr:hypothetical protein [Anaerocolumna cellulosilytica]MBB5194528.1 photosystem II stability/assembly factor-like uncharacterized protein [Anaerocolumna cellulosilytica]BCJ93472.1 hypothetical protein acsn021_10410 [Anaerocolumna cellulosilytica]